MTERTKISSTCRNITRRTPVSARSAKKAHRPFCLVILFARIGRFLAGPDGSIDPWNSRTCRSQGTVVGWRRHLQASLTKRQHRHGSAQVQYGNAFALSIACAEDRCILFTSTHLVPMTPSMGFLSVFRGGRTAHSYSMERAADRCHARPPAPTSPAAVRGAEACGAVVSACLGPPGAPRAGEAGTSATVGPVTGRQPVQPAIRRLIRRRDHKGKPGPQRIA